MKAPSEEAGKSAQGRATTASTDKTQPGAKSAPLLKSGVDSDKPQLYGPQPTVTDAFKTIKPSDFLTVHQAPCSRQGLLTGIGAGAAVGALRIVLKSPVSRAANWAVGSFVLGSILQYEYCQYRRREEKAKMKRVVEVYDRKQAEMRAQQRDEQDRLRHDGQPGKGGGMEGNTAQARPPRTWTSWFSLR